MQDKINKLLFETTKLNEYQLSHKNDLIGIVNQLVLATKQSPNAQELDKKLNTLLEFYRFYQKGFPFEDKIVYEEFKAKLLKLAKDNNITLK